MTGSIVFIFGLLFGSFLNVCIYRIPAGQSIVHPPSRCGSCQTRLKPWDLVPVFSYLWLRGRCRYCQAAVSPRYPLVELLTGAIFLWCYAVFDLSHLLPAALLLSLFLIVISFIDYDHQLILDKVLVWLAGAGLLFNLYTNQVGFFDMLGGGLLGGGLLLVIALASRGGMGGGDVKFAATLGLWLGVKLTILSLFLSFFLGGVGGALLLLLGIKKRKDMIPFGPFLAAGAFLTVLYSQDIIFWYFRLLW